MLNETRGLLEHMVHNDNRNCCSAVIEWVRVDQDKNTVVAAAVDIAAAAVDSPYTPSNLHKI